MNVAAGTRLGPYEVVERIGAGGMGEVYRGTDTRLNRVVALKVLPSHLSTNAQYRERFDREARAISGLTHPHICTLYDVGHQDGTDYLVMEFVDGESLADRLSRGPLPMEQVFRYGIEIADALDKAHRGGIIHRDLKPSNIMITKSGAKLLDFGLAKIAMKEQPVLQLSVMPTAQRDLTAEGTILGTFQYMAPEQLEGVEADARTDIFALGSVLYEMATGRHAFEGKTKTSLIAAIVDRDPPPISSIQPLTPPAFERVVKTCLAKDPDDRWQSARDIANELRWIQQSGGDISAGAGKQPHRNTREWIAWTVATIAIVAAAIFAMIAQRLTSQPQATVRSEIDVPDKSTFPFSGINASLALSPDGRRLVFAVTTEGKSMLWLRPLDATAAQPLSGTENATFPFWSPDSRFIAFFTGGKLKRLDIAGGPPVAICDSTGQPRGGSWNSDGIIIFAPNTRDPIMKVSAAGGRPTPVTKLSTTEFSHRWPVFLPDGHHFLFFAQDWARTTIAERNKLWIGSIDSFDRRPLMPSNGPALFVQPHYLLYTRDRSLLVQQFDPQKLVLSGDPVPVAERIHTFPNTTAALFSASQNGVLAYQATDDAGDSHFAWVDRTGKEIEALIAQGSYSHPRLSHDGKRIAYELTDPPTGLHDIWTFDVTRRVATRFTFEVDDEMYPIWSADDSMIIYSRTEGPGNINLYAKSSTGGGTAQPLFSSRALKIANDAVPGGRILFQNNDPRTSTNWDIWELVTGSREQPRPVIATNFVEASAQLSPDGRWIAYLSDQSGAANVYIEPYASLGAKYQASTTGGFQPRWSRDGKELFYTTADGRMFAVKVKEVPGGVLELSEPQFLFDTHLSNLGGYQYDVAAGGKFLMNVAPAQRSQPITLVTNWIGALKQ